MAHGKTRRSTSCPLLQRPWSQGEDQPAQVAGRSVLFGPVCSAAKGGKDKKMTTYGYARVSTNGQDLSSQEAELLAAGCAKLFKEKVSGAKTDRAELAKVTELIEKRPGATARPPWRPMVAFFLRSKPTSRRLVINFIRWENRITGVIILPGESKIPPGLNDGQRVGIRRHSGYGRFKLPA
jgi:hypothetical protein